MTPQPIAVVYFDLDGVLADFHGALAREVGRLGFEVPNDLCEVFFNDAYQEVLNHVSRSHGFWDTLEPIEEGLGALKRVRENTALEVRIASSPWFPISATPKLEWCKERLDIDPEKVVLASNKEVLASGVNGVPAILIDDSAPNCIKFAKAGGMALLVAQPWSFHQDHYVARMTGPNLRVTGQNSLVSAVAELDAWAQGVPF